MDRRRLEHLAGAYFGHVLDVDRVAIDPKLWTPTMVKQLTTTRTDGMTDAEIAKLDPPTDWTPAPRMFTPFMTLDFGVSAPSGLPAHAPQRRSARS